MSEPLSDDRLVEIERYASVIEWDREGQEAIILELLAEVRRLREIDRAQELLTDVLANPGKYPEIEDRAREMTGCPYTEAQRQHGPTPAEMQREQFKPNPADPPAWRWRL